MSLKILSLTVFIVLSGGLAAAQTTAFNFQGKLNDGGSAANGNYDFQFRLFGAITGGAQVGSTLDRPNVAVSDGVFSTTLDFGASPFGANTRFLEIAVRPAGSSNAYVVLGARQQILAVPYAVSASTAGVAQNANTLGGIAPGQFARLNEPNLGFFILEGTFQQVGSLSTTNLSVGQNATVGGTANLGTATVSGNSSVGGNAAVTGNSTVGGTSTLNGNVIQPAAANGAAKALIYVSGFGGGGAGIFRCYNGVTGSAAGNCGFTLTEPLGQVGVYRINFGFSVSERFVVATSRYGGSSSTNNQNVMPQFRFFDGTTIEFFLTRLDSPADTRAYDFMVMVF